MAQKGVNKWIGIGNACSYPETKYLPSGGAVTNLSIACNDSYKDKQSGQMVDKTEFVRLVFFNRLAEIVGEYVKKGSKLYIEGRLQTRKWQDQSGNDRYTTEIVAGEMQMIDSRQGAGGGAPEAGTGSPENTASVQQPDQSQPAPGFDDFDDDIPF